MSSSPSSEANVAPHTAKESDQVSLGPACLVVAILGGLVISVGFTTIAWMMIGREPSQASAAIQQQLIPWVEQSELAPTDKASILERLKDLTASIDRGELDSRQLLRVRNRLSDSPILQWGAVQKVQQAIQESEMTEAEKQDAEVICDRLLRSAADHWLSNQQLEFVMQNVATSERRSGRLVVKSDISVSEMREFLRRASSLADDAKVPVERFDKSVAQVLRIAIDEAIQGPKSSSP